MNELLEWYIDERLDRSDLMRMVVPITSPKATLLALDSEVRWRERVYVIAEREEERNDAEATVKIEAEALWYELNRDTYVGPFELDQVTALEGLQAILAGTGWAADEVVTSSSATLHSLEAEDQTYLALLRAWAKVTGLHLRFDTAARLVHLSEVRGRTLATGFRYRRNIRSIRRRVRAPQVTRVYALGADDLNFAGINGGLPYVEDLSYYTALGVDLEAIGPDGRTNRERLTRAVVLKDTSFVDDTSLLAWAERQLESLSVPVITYELDVADLSAITGIAEPPARCGDTVRVNDPDFGVDLRATVVRVERHPNQPERDRIELSVAPPDPPSSATSVGRNGDNDAWFQFVGPIRANFQIRNDATWTVARIPLRYKQGGRCHVTLDIAMLGFGDGVATVEIYDDEADTTVKSWSIPYTDATESTFIRSFALENIQTGAKDYRLRVSVAGSGGPSPTNGVDLTVENYQPDEEGTESDAIGWWIMAQRAVRETPTIADTSQTFNYASDNVQTFVVPDNVEEVTIEAVGAGGAGGAAGGRGGKVTAKFAVTPGETLYVWAPDAGQTKADGGLAGWPGGGAGTGGVGTAEDGGGGFACVQRGSSTLNVANVLILAGGGGGGGGGTGNGGDGGFFVGESDVSSFSGRGGTQYAGGAGGVGGSGNGAAGSAFQGGNGGNGGPLSSAGGGGGGGLYGGGGGGYGFSNQAGGGGGGSGWVDPSGFDLEVEDGGGAANDENGHVTFYWNDPGA